jgi:hypothetical protein
MSSQIKEGQWRCSICHMTYSTVVLADSCEKSHKILYVPMNREDLNLLIQFIFTGGQSSLPERLVKTLLEFTKVKDRNHVEEDLHSVSQGD